MADPPDSPVPSTPPSSLETSSHVPVPRWLRRALGAVLVLAFLYLGMAFVASRFLDPEELAGWLEPRLEEALDRDVHVDRVEVGFLPLAIRLQDLTLADPTGLVPELAQVSSLDLRVEILPLLRREVRVSRLTIDGLQADLRISPEGESNFAHLSTPQGGTSEETRGPSQGRRPFTLELRGLRLVNSEIRYRDDSSPLDALVEEIRLRAAARRDSEGSWLLVGSSEGVLSVGREPGEPLLDGVPLALAFDLSADQGFDNLEVRTGELAVGRLTFALSGGVTDLKDPVRNVALELDAEGLPLPGLLALLPDSLRNRAPLDAEGSLAVALSVNGGVGQGTTPQVQGRIQLAEGRLTLRGEELAKDLSADLDLRADRSVQTRAQASVLEGPFSVDGRVTLGEGLDLVVRANPDLSRVRSVVDLPEGISAQGRLPSEVRIVGPMSSLDGLRFSGNVRADGIRATHPSLGVPVQIPEGEVVLSGRGASLTDLPILLGQDRLTISGKISDLFAFLTPEATPRFDGAARGARLDLRSLSTRPLPDSTLTYGKVAFAKVGGRQVAGRSVEAAAEELGLTRPDSLPLGGTLQLQVDTVLDKQGRMEDVRAQVDFGPGFLRVTDATFRRFGGEIRTSADLTLAPEAGAPFSFSLQVLNLDAGAFLSNATPLGSFVRGRITLQLDLVGTLDTFLLPDRPSLVGSGSFSVTGGGLATVPLTRRISEFLGVDALREPSFQDWASSFVLDHGRVALAESTLQGAPGSPRVGGSVGLDGALDLRSAFDLPTDRLSTSALDRLGVAGELAARVAQRPEVVQAILRIGGSVLDPSIQADPMAAVRTLGQAVQDEVRREAQEQIEAQAAEARRVMEDQKSQAQQRIEEQKQDLRNRATGFLRSLVQRPDTVAAPAPPDSVRPDTAQADTVRPDTVQPDTMGPDTLRPDTLRPDTVRPDTLRPDTSNAGRPGG